MKSWLVGLAFAVAGTTFTFVPVDAEARRLGGGRAAGMQRQAPAKPAESTPAQPATPPTAANAATGATAAATGAAAAGKRSWMGPIAGLAAGLGIAALLSHFGMGEGFSNIVMMILLAVAAVALFRFVMRRFAGGGATGSRASGLQMAGAGAGAASAHTASAPALRSIPMPPESRPSDATFRSSFDGGSAAAPSPQAAAPRQASDMPVGFDAAEFERIAKMIFIRMQASNDGGHVDDLRKFTTPELFASLRVDLQERGSAMQNTDVPVLDAKVVDTAREDDQWIVSVRFTGTIIEEAGTPAQPFAELWHLVKPVDGSREWAIAGITPEN